MMYTDFEVIFEPIQEREPGACTLPGGGDPEEPYTKEVNQHIPSGYCIYSKFVYGDVKDPLTIYRGKGLCLEVL